MESDSYDLRSFPVPKTKCTSLKDKPFAHVGPSLWDTLPLGMENLWGRAGEVQKNYLRKGKLNEKKIHARQLIKKKYSFYSLKKFLQGIWWQKKFLWLENSPPPPHNFSNGPSLS